MSHEAKKLGAVVAKAAHRLHGSARDYDALIDSIGDARVVLLGEATHGTHEFYRERALITARLIEEKGFAAVAVEADWPDAYRVNRFVSGHGDDRTADESLAGFSRFPTWMWRNTPVVDFVTWLYDHNHERSHGLPVGFYGLDLYSMYASIRAVLGFLDRVDPASARRARERYACFDHHGESTQGHTYSAGLGIQRNCEDEATEVLLELSRVAAERARSGPRHEHDAFFFAQENARLVRNAERYYRTMFHGRISSWNLRDRHMAETLASLLAHLDSDPERREPARVVVWAHNSHLGDARATEMGDLGELTLGQLVRERYGRATRLIGLSTYQGSVTAASSWDSVAEHRRVRPALVGSYEDVFHHTGMERFYLDLRQGGGALAGLSDPRLERAIGVIYRPHSERTSHYFHARLLAQFDGLLHFDTTRAVEPLEQTPVWLGGEPPETFPSEL